MGQATWTGGNKLTNGWLIRYRFGGGELRVIRR